jgi:hypothetical protein
VLVDVSVPGKLGGRQWRRKLGKRNMERSKKPGNQQDHMEEFHGCPMLQKEIQELRRRRGRRSEISCSKELFSYAPLSDVILFVGHFRTLSVAKLHSIQW